MDTKEIVNEMMGEKKIISLAREKLRMLRPLLLASLLRAHSPEELLRCGAITLHIEKCSRLS